MSVTIVPTVLASDIDDFNKRLTRLMPFADSIHIDIADGKFVPSTTISLDQVPDVNRWPEKEFEVHLMVERPGAYIQPMARRGFKRIIFHLEAADDVSALIELCKKHDVVPIIGLKPETPVDNVLKYTSTVDEYAVMGGHPGFNGAPYLPETPTRVRALLETAKRKLIIQIDIGMTPETVGDVVRAGALRINSGSFISNAKDPKKAFDELKQAAENAQVTE